MTEHASTPASPARTRAEEKCSDARADEQLQLVSFQVGEETFAIDILSVHEINRLMELTRVPQSRSDVEGVVNLRGRIVPVIDLRTRFGLGPSERSSESRIVVVEVRGIVLGLIVDRVHEVLRISGSIVDSPPAMASSIHADFVAGVAKLNDRLVILLDPARLFTGEEIEEAAQSAARAA